MDEKNGNKARESNGRRILAEQMEADRKRKAEEEERRRAEAEARAKEAEERRRQEAERIAAERAEREKALAEQQAQEERTSESGYNTPVPDKAADVQNEEPAEKPAEKEVLPEEKKYKAKEDGSLFTSCKSCGVPPDRCKGFCIFQRMTAEAEKQKQEEKSNGKI